MILKINMTNIIPSNKSYNVLITEIEKDSFKIAGRTCATFMLFAYPNWWQESVQK